MKLALLFLALCLCDAHATLARWREALELDLAREVLDEAPALVTGKGELAADAEALALYARALSSAGKGAQARALLEHAVVAEPQRVRLAVALARLDLEQDKLAEARARLAKIEQPDAEAALVLGRAWYRAGESGRARPLLERALELAPLDSEAPAAWHMLAAEARTRGDKQRAAQCAEREEKSAQWQAYYKTRRLQVRASPKDPLPRYGIAELWIAAGEDARARAVLDELLALAPDFARAELALARVEKRAGKSELAAQHFAKYRALGGTEEL
jgi:tetratricopeptide (TPR) repeat protein